MECATLSYGIENAEMIKSHRVFLDLENPRVPVPFQDEDEAIAIANDPNYGLYGYVSSGDTEHAKEIANRIRAGSVAINGAQSDFTTPFGGYKQSGNGREWGPFGFEEFLETKAVVGYSN